MLITHKLQPVISEFKKSLRLSMPLIGSQLIYASNGIVTVMMIAHLGQKELATNVLVWGIYITLISISFGILSAVGILTAHSYGANNKDNIKTILNQGIILSFVLSIPMILSILIAPEILYLSNQNPEIIKTSIPYFYSLAWCILPLNLLFAMEQLLIGISITRLVLFLSFVRVPVELFLFYALFFGKWGFPKLGLPGIGYGMAISIVAALIIIICYICFSRKMKQYQIFSSLPLINRKYTLELLRVGWPLGSMYCIEMALFAIAALMIGQFGKDILAAHQIAYQCLVFTLAIIFGLSQGATIRIGHEIGLNNKQAITSALYVNMAIAFCFMLAILAIYVFLPTKIIALGVDITNIQNKSLVEYVTWFLLLAGILQLTESLRLISMGGLRALKDTKMSMYITLFTFWLIAIPTSYILSTIFNFGATGVWIGLIIGLSIGAFTLFLRFIYILRHADLKKIITR